MTTYLWRSSELIASAYLLAAHKQRPNRKGDTETIRLKLYSHSPSHSHRECGLSVIHQAECWNKLSIFSISLVFYDSFVYTPLWLRSVRTTFCRNPLISNWSLFSETDSMMSSRTLPRLSIMASWIFHLEATSKLQLCKHTALLITITFRSKDLFTTSSILFQDPKVVCKTATHQFLYPRG